MGFLALFLPILLFLAISIKNISLVPLFYWMPHFPMAILLGKIVSKGNSGHNLDSVSTSGAVISLLLNLPLYYFLYEYLDQVIPDTYGISKPFCFCLKRKNRPEAPSPLRNNRDNDDEL